MLMKKLLGLLCFAYLIAICPMVSQAQPLYEDGLHEKIKSLNLNTAEYKTPDGNRFYAVNNVVTKDSSDAAGALAISDIVLSKFQDKESYELRKKFYTIILSELIAMEDVSDLTMLLQDVFFSQTLDPAISELEISSDGSDTLNKLTDLSKALSAKDGKMRDFIITKYRNFFGIPRESRNFRNVDAHMEEMSSTLEDITFGLEEGAQLLKMSRRVIVKWFCMEIETGIMLDRLEAFEMWLNYLRSDCNTEFCYTLIVHDQALVDAISGVRDNLVKKSDSFLDALVSFYKTDTEFQEDVWEASGIAGKFIISKTTAFLLAKISFKSNFITWLAVEAVGELFHEFAQAPKKIIQHFFITSMLGQIYAIEPVTDGGDVYKDNDKLNLQQWLKLPISKEIELIKNDWGFLLSEDEVLMQKQMQTYLLYMFYKNLAEIMDDTGWLDYTFLQWINPGQWIVWVFDGGDKIDRNNVRDGSQEIQKMLLIHYNNLNTHKPLSIDIMRSDINSLRAPITVKYDIVNNTRDSIVLWQVMDNNSPIYTKTDDVYPFESLEYRFEKEGEYSIIATAIRSNTHESVYDIDILSVRSSLVEVKDIHVAIDNASGKSGKIYTFIEYADNPGYPEPYRGGIAVDQYQSPGVLSWSVKTPNLLGITKNLWDPSSIIYTSKVQESAGLEGELEVSFQGFSKIVSVKLYEVPAFKDIPVGNWYYTDYVKPLLRLGIVAGYQDGTFGPEKPVKRGEFIKMAVASYSAECRGDDLSNCGRPRSDLFPKYYPEGDSFEGYVDVKDHWSYPYIKQAWNLGWLDKSKTEFEPEKLMNRAEVAKILATVLNDVSLVCTEKPFNDVSPDAWYAPYIVKLKEKQIVNGYSDGTFRPENNINRSEVCKMVYQTFKAYLPSE